MNKSFTILVVLALVLGAGSIVLIKKIIDAERQKIRAEIPATGGQVEEIKMSPALYVKDDLDAGTPLTNMNIGVKQLPASAVPESALQSLDQITDKFAYQALFKDELLLQPKARSRAELPRPSMTIEKGRRLVSVRVDEVKANSYLIKNGDYVDLVGSFVVDEENLASKTNPPIGAKITVTFMQRVKVFDIINGQLQAAKEGDQANQTGRVAMGTNATFEVTPEEAKIITNAESVASSIWLVLRRFDDQEVMPPGNEMEKNILANLLRESPNLPPPPKPEVKSAPRRTVF